MQSGDITLQPEQPARRPEIEPSDLRLEIGTALSFTGDSEPQPRPSIAQGGKRVDQQIETLLEIEPANCTDHNLVLAVAELVANGGNAPRVADEDAVVDAVENHRHPFGLRARMDQLVSDGPRDGDHSGKPRE